MTDAACMVAGMGKASRERRATAEAWRVLTRFIAEAPARPPHMPIDGLLHLGEALEHDQGRLTEFQVRVLAAFLLAAADMAPDERHPEFKPRWHHRPDAVRWHEDVLTATTPQRTATMLRAGILARH
jgi:hypothetical protein